MPSELSPRERRLAENEALLREVNEQVAAQAARFGPARDAHVYEFFCECSNRDCDARLPLSREEYEAVRADPTQFVVVRSHELPDIEFVVEERGAHSIVRKREPAATFVERLDPRSRDVTS